MDWRGGAAGRSINDGRRCLRRVFRKDVIINHRNGAGRERKDYGIEEPVGSRKKWGRELFSSSAFVSATWIGRFFFSFLFLFLASFFSFLSFSLFAAVVRYAVIKRETKS